MAEIKLTHLQRRRLVQLEKLAAGVYRHNGQHLTSHWSVSKAANQTLCDLGLAERVGQTFHHPSGKQNGVGQAEITAAGIAWLVADRLDRPEALSTPDTGRK